MDRDRQTGGSFITAAAFASDAITVGNRLTISAGVRFAVSIVSASNSCPTAPRSPCSSSSTARPLAGFS